MSLILPTVGAHLRLGRGDERMSPVGRVEGGGQLQDEQPLSQKVHGRTASTRVSRGDEGESTLQMADEGGERGKLVAPRAQRGVEAFHVAVLEWGERGEMLGEEREEEERGFSTSATC